MFNSLEEMGLEDMGLEGLGISGSGAPAGPYIPDAMDCRSCNQCLSHCPTARVMDGFGESPQGRVRLIERVLTGGEALDEAELSQLNDCVECRACEKVCPSKMAYRDLLASAREKLPEPRPSMLVRALLAVTRRKGRLLAAMSLLRGYQRSGLPTLLKGLGLMRLNAIGNLHRLLPRVPPRERLPEETHAVGEIRGRVALFTGCFSHALDSQGLNAAVRLLTALGYTVRVPPGQQCCGLAHANNGDTPGVDELTARNQAVFDALEVDAVIYTASACGARLKESGGEGKTRFVDINAFIAESFWPETLRLKPLERPVYVHEPCSQQYPEDTSRFPYEILERIPGIRMQPLPDNRLCCGAGGTYRLTHPGISERIRAEKLGHLENTDKAILVSANIGCALHLETGIREAGLDVEVMHPVSLLAGQCEPG